MKHLIFLMPLMLAASAPVPNPYSADLLAEPAIMDRAKWVVDLTQFNNWLNENHAKLPPERLSGPREHTYLLIDSILRDQHSEGRSEFTEIELWGLTTLFNWGARLGLYGSGLVASQLAVEEAEKLAEPRTPPEPFQLALEFPMLTLASKKSGWDVMFPYYFMVGDLRHFESKAGHDTELAIISTLFARHQKSEGHSQATIMLVFSPTHDVAAFRALWLELNGLSKIKKHEKGLLAKADTYYSFNKAEDMHKELTFFSAKSGQFLVSYLGRDGTYQVNRSDYLIFLTHIRYE